MGRLEEFEAELLLVDELDDPLSVFDRYHRYLLSLEADEGDITRLLERATQKFVSDRRYRNDPRYLRLWLSYATRCSDPEDVYAFLAMEGISADLASYYEDYSAFLERKADIGKAFAVLKAGVDRMAQPMERLKKSYGEFLTRNHLQNEIPLNPIMPSSAPMTGVLPSKRLKPIEVSGYRKEIIYPNATEEFCFEEIRARGWRRTGSILKTSEATSSNTSMMRMEEEVILDHFEGEFDTLTPANPDELTYVSVYKDNTADLRDLARSLNFSSKTSLSLSSTMPNQMENSSTSQPLSQHSISAFLTSTNSANPSSMDISFDEFLEPLDKFQEYERKRGRLSLIPEESDGTTQVSGFIPSMLRKLQAANGIASPTLSKGPVIITNSYAPTVSYLTASLLSEQRQLCRTVYAESREPLMSKIKAVEKSIGRDGEGNNHTVASLNIACGHYFVEKKLSDRIYLAADLDADIASQSLHQSTLKLTDDLWEAHLLNKLNTSIPAFPCCLKVAKHPDGCVFTETFYPHGTLAQMIADPSIDEKLLLFWYRELVKSVANLNGEKQIIHGSLRPEHVMIRLAQETVSSSFEANGSRGWSGHGIALVSFSRSIDAATFSSGIELDKELLARYRAELGEGCPSRVVLLDIYGLAGCLEAISEARGSNLRFQELWTSIGALLARSLMTGTIVGVFEELVRLLDSVLIPQAASPPTLKSLLTRLEISLLERSSTK